jgi:hypothetical protein
MTALFVAGAGGSGNQQLATSPDGITWTIRTAVAIPGSYVFQAVVWSPELAKFVAVTNGYGSVTSPDGITWTASSATITAYGLAWSPLKAIFVASAGSGVFTSPDGLTWTSRTAGLGASGILNTVVWSPELAKFVAGGSQSTDLIFTSPDGITWTQTASFGVSEVTALAWSPALSLLVAGAWDGKIWTSPDGTTWTARTSGVTTKITSAVWSRGRGLFVAGASASGVITSPDGITWTTISAAGNTQAVTWSPTLGIFVAAGTNSGVNTSPDGITWTFRSPVGAYPVQSLAWSGIENTAPYAPTGLAPASGSLDRSTIQRLAWTFTDPDFGDTQSKFDLQWRLGAGAWQPVTGTTPNRFWDAPAATFPAGSIEWQVRTYDAGGLISPWSASAFFTAAAAPVAPTITAPTSGGTVSSTATLTWSAPAQADYQYRRVGDISGSADTATIYYDSGDVIDSTTRSRIVSHPVNSRWEHVQVRIKSSGLWSPWTDIRVFVSFTAPPVPTIVATADNATASVTVAISNPSVPTRTNLCINPSFETDTSGWYSQDATRDGTTSSVGVGSGKIVAPAANSGSYFFVDLPCAPGDVFTLSVDYKTGATISGAWGLYYQMSAGPVGSTLITARSTFGRASLTTLVVPTGVTSIRIFPMWSTGNSGAGDTIWIDAVLIEKTSVANPYFDGNTPNTTGVTYAWTGAPNASMSTGTSTAPSVSFNDVWISSPLDPAYRAATGVPPNTTWRWWTPGAGRLYTIWVVAIGNNATTSQSV